ncbi:MAG: hypothetical protein M5U12_07310 [Verrucomicrobia bacterium]|nr:hypothetical protein [Verrucomicrobiota bacterium]
MIRLAPTRLGTRILLTLGCLNGWLSHAAPDDETVEPWPYHRQSTWVQTLGVARAAWKTAPPRPEEREAALEAWWQRLRDDFPVECDWAAQDGGWDPFPWLSRGPGTDWERRVITRALAGWSAPHALSDAFRLLCTAAPGPEDPRWMELYAKVATARRIARLATVTAQVPQFVFTRRRTVRPSFFAYTEGQSDAQSERHFLPGAALCRFEWDGQAGSVHTLLEDPAGVIRDPAVSWDGQRIVFAWKKALDEDDYHLYELNLATHRLRQLTSGLGFADYEPAFLPNGDLIFASTRCVQTVDCWWTEVSNLYTCDADGRFLRRLGFDQVHTVYPQVLDDGRVIYTRWDYNDRGQVFPNPCSRCIRTEPGRRSSTATTPGSQRRSPTRGASRARHGSWPSSAAITPARRASWPSSTRNGVATRIRGCNWWPPYAERKPNASTATASPANSGSTRIPSTNVSSWSAMHRAAGTAPVDTQTMRTSRSTGWTSRDGANCWCATPPVPVSSRCRSVRGHGRRCVPA